MDDEKQGGGRRKGTERMKAATRANICDLAAELNYRPNRTARALVMGRTGAVAVVIGLFMLIECIFWKENWRRTKSAFTTLK